MAAIASSRVALPLPLQGFAGEGEEEVRVRAHPFGADGPICPGRKPAMPSTPDAIALGQEQDAWS